MGPKSRQARQGEGNGQTVILAAERASNYNEATKRSGPTEYAQRSGPLLANLRDRNRLS